MLVSFSPPPIPITGDAIDSDTSTANASNKFQAMKLRVLIVDDNRTIQHILQHFLSRMLDMQTMDAALDGASAVEMTLQRQYDIVRN